MKLGTIVVAAYLLGFVLTIVGAYLKITHSEGADLLLGMGLVALLVFIVSAIIEVRRSNRNHVEKTFWTIALLMFSTVAGLIYLFVRSRRHLVAS